MIDRITSTAEVAASRVTAVIYGDPGVGKTTLAKTLPGKGLILSAESGLLSLAGTAIDVLEIMSLEDMRQAYAWLSEEPRGYDWLFIDSLTEIGQQTLNEIEKAYPDRSKALVMWGEYGKAMLALAKAFRDIRPYSVYFTALPKVDKDEVGRRFVGLDIAGKSSERMLAIFDEVWSLQVVTDSEGNQGRWLITQPYNGWKGKDRSGKLDLFEPPHLGKINLKILSQTPATPEGAN